MPKLPSEAPEAPIATIGRWECVRAWNQLLLCLHCDDGETRVFALDREQAEMLGLDLQTISQQPPED